MMVWNQGFCIKFNVVESAKGLWQSSCAMKQLKQLSDASATVQFSKV